MTELRLKTAAIIYGSMAILAVLIGLWRGDPDLFHHSEGVLTPYLSGPQRVAVGAVSGIAFGLIVAYATRQSVYRFTWAQQLHMEFRGLFGPTSGADILGFAAFSAVAEELFFRGALQPIMGIVPTSILFGLLHIAPGKRYLPWPFQALTMGFAFGGLFRLGGDLTAPILAHFTINYQNLHFINRYDPAPKLPRALLQNR